MRSLPPLAVAVALAACADQPPPPPDPATAALPFGSAPLASGEWRFVSDGDTLRLVVRPPEDGRQQLLRVVSGAADDRTTVLIDAATKLPVESRRVALTAAGDSVTAHVEYGRGFEGQARLALSTADGSAEENLRTPPPSLDAGQLPHVLSALPLTDADSLHFNYVAPFEKEALAARLLVGRPEELRVGETVVRATRVRLQVSGLEERYWFSERSPHALLRIEETTRDRTWTALAASPP